ncbi:MAG TPA: 23S rRNA (pseudouridine(1915)-N(3))-methyltransferase RlmH [Desulfobacteria bacterium]|nr:23S rRNA (pseudouridine(1915)-N(3))-methyltransferase RlmH [Desulfobacteria bacterium]
MQIRVVAVGKLKERFWRAAVEEYLKRLKSYAKVEVVEVGDEKCPEFLTPAQELAVKDKEGERIIRGILPGSYIIALNLKGREYTSEEFAAFISDLAVNRKSQISVVIGGSLGLSAKVLETADLQLVFSRFTFPHQLIRVVLLEQVYRAFKIIRQEPYHK